MANAEAVIEGNQIVIRLDIGILPLAVEGGIDMGTITPGGKVVDAGLFALDVVNALNQEEEDGTNIIHLLFDQAFEIALDFGAQGVLYEGDGDYGDGDEEEELEDDDDLPW
jgi:hypothetical protein